MSENKVAPWKTLYLAGAVSAFLYTALAIAPIALVFTPEQPPVEGGAGVLQYIASHRLVYLTELICFVGLSAPALVVFLALWAAGKDRDPSLAAIAGVIGIASEVVALSLGSSPQSLHGGLMYLSAQYARAAGEVERAALAAAADGLVAAANAVSAAGILTAAGILLSSLVMRKAGHRAVGHVGIITGAIGIVSEALRPLIGFAYSVFGALLLAWFILVGVKMLALARHAAQPEGLAER